MIDPVRFIRVFLNEAGAIQGEFLLEQLDRLLALVGGRGVVEYSVE